MPGGQRITSFFSRYNSIAAGQQRDLGSGWRSHSTTAHLNVYAPLTCGSRAQFCNQNKPSRQRELALVESRTFCIDGWVHTWKARDGVSWYKDCVINVDNI